PEQSGIYKSKEQFRPSGITVAPNGDVYVTDGYGLNYIHRYNSKGEYINSWGGKSTQSKEDSKFNTPHKIIIDQREKQPLLLVTDRANHRLQWFTLEGRHVRTVDGTSNDLMRLPSVLSIRGTDLAIGDLMGRITILDKDHKLITHMGESKNPMPSGRNRIPPEEWVDGVFVAVHGMTWDKQGDLYISEYALPGRVEKLKRL
ncbi:MAG TPA: peptidase, partial [Blastocatellia bacterium]|nr:peptidase [Blastocatellia bacterium]